MRMNRYLSVLLVLVCHIAAAQTIPVVPTYGSVSEYECSFRKYDSEPFASAMILWESCDRIIDYSLVYSEGQCITYYKQRIKILRESGRHYASDKIVVNAGSGEQIKDLKVTTYNLEDGKVVSYPASKSDIRRSWIDDSFQQLSYNAPKVRAGSVIEISYVLTTPLFDAVPTFNFRRSIPVNLCTYTIAYPQGLHRRMQCLDYEHDAISYSSGDDTHAGLLYDAFQAVDLPSFKDEPMVYCPDVYLGSVSFEIGDLEWSDVAREFSESAVMYQLKSRTPFRKEIKDIVAVGKDGFTTMCEVVSLVKKTVKWNRQIAFLPKDFSGVGGEYFGSSADLNSIVGAALTEAGFNVTPVLVCLRTDGVVLEDFPTYGRFSTFILHITGPDGTDVYFDAANPCGYFNVLPDNYLVSNGFELLKNGSYKWVDLSSPVNSVTTYAVMANALPDGTMAGVVTGQFFNHAAFHFKESIYGVTSETLGDRMREMFNLDHVGAASVDGIYEPASCCSLKVKFQKKNEVNDSLMFVKPFVTPLLSSDMFRRDTRVLPVDFPYPEGINYVFKVGIPFGYEVAELPQPLTLSCSLPSGCVMTAESDEKSVSIYFKFENMAYFAGPAKYEELRAYWKSVCDALECKIVFRKID